MEDQPPDRGQSDQLLITCAMCGRSFPSGISSPRESFEDLDLPRRLYDCPFCGFVTAYDRTDYHYDPEGAR